jgi:hypothetical protein
MPKQSLKSSMHEDVYKRIQGDLRNGLFLSLYITSVDMPIINTDQVSWTYLAVSKVVWSNQYSSGIPLRVYNLIHTPMNRFGTNSIINSIYNSINEYICTL